MGDQPQRRARAQTDVDDRGVAPNDGPQYVDAARNEIWHVHAKAGDVVFVNRDDPRRVEMEVENGGRIVPVSQRDFIRNGGRIGTDQYGNPYPPFVWQSHPDVPSFENSRGPYSLPRAQRRNGVDIHVEIGSDGRGHVYRSNGRWGDERGGYGCGRRGGYPHTGRDWDPDWRGSNPNRRRDWDPDWRGSNPNRGRYPGGCYPPGDDYPGRYPDGRYPGGRYPRGRAEISIGARIPIGDRGGSIIIGTDIPIGDNRRRRGR